MQLWGGQSVLVGGANIARFPVVLMIGLPSVFELKVQLGFFQLPSALQPVSVFGQIQNTGTSGAQRGCCHANHFSIFLTEVEWLSMYALGPFRVE